MYIRDLYVSPHNTDVMMLGEIVVTQCADRELHAPVSVTANSANISLSVVSCRQFVFFSV
jgi:hypothetical protein